MGTALTVCALIAGVLWISSKNATRRLSATRELAKALAAGKSRSVLNIQGGDERIDLMGAELSEASRSLDEAISTMIQSMEAAARQDFSKIHSCGTAGRTASRQTGIELNADFAAAVA